MDGPVYPRALRARGIEADVPEADDRQIVHRIIFEELVHGVFTDAALAEYIGIIERLRDRGCDAVAVVCTEIPLLVSPDASPLPTLDSTVLMAHAAFEVAVDHRPLANWHGRACQRFVVELALELS
jgi:aspartate/glutamate racemase